MPKESSLFWRELFAYSNGGPEAPSSKSKNLLISFSTEPRVAPLDLQPTQSDAGLLRKSNNGIPSAPTRMLRCGRYRLPNRSIPALLSPK